MNTSHDEPQRGHSAGMNRELAGTSGPLQFSGLRTLGHSSTWLSRVFALAMATVLLIALPMSSSASAQDQSVVSVVHGLRGELVDVYLDGKLVLPGFQPDRIADPVTIPSGPHKVDLRPAGSPADSEPRASATPDLPPGPVAVVAHFAPDGSWTMSVFPNVVVSPPPGSGELIFRNVSATSPVAIEVDGATAAKDLASGQEDRFTTSAARHTTAVDSTTNKDIVPAADANLSNGSAVALYLVGQGNELTWLRQNLAETPTAPRKVDAGNSGLRADSSGFGSSLPTAPTILIGLGLILLAVGVVLPRATRHRQAVRS